jgi:DNA-binding IscR family transcriptional regulator
MEQHRDAMTSERIGQMLGTNPTVVRRTMAGLREAGYVSSVKGHGGGWTLARPLADITLLDVYKALGAPELFALGMATDAPECLVEQAVNAALGQSLEEAERRLLARFGEVKLSEIAADFTRRAGDTKRGTCQGRHVA